MAQNASPRPKAESPWRVLLRLRWPLGGAIALAFALGQMLERLVWGNTYSQPRIVFDIVGWGLLGGVAIWLSLTWVSRQERRYQASLEQTLRDQHELNQKLQRANSQLALLSDVNRHIAGSTTLDEILDAALAFPQQLVRARAAALLLTDAAGPIETRVEGASTDEITALRKRAGVTPPDATARHPFLLAGAGAQSDASACLIVPLHDGLAPLGWIELYIEPATVIAADELALLDTIGSEIAEAITSARRRSHQERATYELERAIAEERARIARDIHDGIAQTLAFRRMRIDLWLDWLESDRERLRGELIENKQVLREQISELRRAIFALRPVQFDELGFVGGLQRYIVEFAGQHGWEAHVDLGDAPSTLAPDVEANCFRVIQEALTNVAKHAQATRVDVAIEQADEGLWIIIRDNGLGFEAERLPEQGTGHVGLRQMRERLQAIQGQLMLFSRPGDGTQVRAWVPLAAQTRRSEQ